RGSPRQRVEARHVRLDRQRAGLQCPTGGCRLRDAEDGRRGAELHRRPHNVAAGMNPTKRGGEFHEFWLRKKPAGWGVAGLLLLLTTVFYWDVLFTNRASFP